MQKSLSRSDWVRTPVIFVVNAWSSLLSCRRHGKIRTERAHRTGSRPLPAEDETRAGRDKASSAAVDNSSLASSSVIRWQPSRPPLASMAF